ncbi:hypothetical protein CR513_04278, partial [Mucuna pruriens]
MDNLEWRVLNDMLTKFWTYVCIFCGMLSLLAYFPLSEAKSAMLIYALVSCIEKENDVVNGEDETAIV